MRTASQERPSPDAHDRWDPHPGTLWALGAVIGLFLTAGLGFAVLMAMSSRNGTPPTFTSELTAPLTADRTLRRRSSASVHPSWRSRPGMAALSQAVTGPVGLPPGRYLVYGRVPGHREPGVDAVLVARG